MSTGASDQLAVDVLLAFFSEMHEWERSTKEWYEQIDWAKGTEEDFKAATERRLDLAHEIFDRYCVAGREAQRFKDVMSFSGDEPDYNPDKEIVLSVASNDRGVAIETKQAHRFQRYFRYEMELVAGDWKIRDNRKSKAAPDKRWVNDPL